MCQAEVKFDQQNMSVIQGYGLCVSCIDYLEHPLKKDELGLLDHSYPLTRNLIEG